MPTARFVSNEDLIVVSADGKFDLAESEAALERLVADLERDPKRNVILDVRRTRCDFSLSEVYNLVDFLAAHGSRKDLYRRIAVLFSSPAHQGKASFFALCAENRGIEAKAFTAPQDVDSWLGGNASRLL